MFNEFDKDAELIAIQQNYTYVSIAYLNYRIFTQHLVMVLMLTFRVDGDMLKYASTRA